MAIQFHLKLSDDYICGHFIWNLLKLTEGLFHKFHLNDHKYKLLYCLLDNWWCQMSQEWCQRNNNIWHCVATELAPLFKMHTHIHSIGPELWLFVLSLHVQTAKALAWLCKCAGSSELSQFAYVISTPFTWAGSYEPHHEKTCLWGLWPGKTQTGLLSYRDELGSWNFGFSKYMYYTI